MRSYCQHFLTDPVWLGKMEIGIIRVGDNVPLEEFSHQLRVETKLEVVIKGDASIVKDTLKYAVKMCDFLILIFSKDYRDTVFRAFTFTFGLIPRVKHNTVLPREFEEIEKDIYVFKMEQKTFLIINDRVLPDFDYSMMWNILGLEKCYYLKIFNVEQREIGMVVGEKEIISDEVESEVIVQGEEEKEEVVQVLRKRFPYSFYTQSGESPEAVLKKLCNLYRLHIATAESCTAGGVSYSIAHISGSSDYFDRGFATYSNKAKHEILGVSWAALNCFGAVSEEVALYMAQGALKRSEADIAVSTTGIAGPTGGTREKPVGLVYFGLATKGKNKVYKKIFTGNRKMVRDKATRFALGMVIEFIKENYERERER